MKKFKLSLTVAVMATCFAVPSFASEDVSALSLQFTLADTQLMFEKNTKPMKLAELSTQEMKDTEGAIWPFIVNAATQIPRVQQFVANAGNAASQPSATTAAAAAYNQVRPAPQAAPIRPDPNPLVNQIPRN